MEEEKISEVVSEVKNANEDELKKVIEQHFDIVRTQSMKIGAKFISAAVMGAIEKNLKKGANSSLRDYQRAVKNVKEIISVQLKEETRQNDLKVEEEADDGTAE